MLIPGLREMGIRLPRVKPLGITLNESGGPLTVSFRHPFRSPLYGFVNAGSCDSDSRRLFSCLYQASLENAEINPDISHFISSPPKALCAILRFSVYKIPLRNSIECCVALSPGFCRFIMFATFCGFPALISYLVGKREKIIRSTASHVTCLSSMGRQSQLREVDLRL